MREEKRKPTEKSRRKNFLKKNLRTKRRKDNNLQTRRRLAKTPTDRELQRGEKPFDKEKRKEPTDK